MHRKRKPKKSRPASFGSPDGAVFLAAARGDLSSLRVMIDAARVLNARHVLLRGEKSPEWLVLLGNINQLAQSLGDGAMDALGALLKAGAPCDEPHRDMLPLEIAACAGSAVAVAALIAAGANPNVGSLEPTSLLQPRPRLPLARAAAIGSVDCVTALLDGGARVNAQDVSGFTALHHAAVAGHPAVALRLLERGADRWVKTHEGGHNPHGLLIRWRKLSFGQKQALQNISSFEA
jgi:ankyrin repeat protein